MKKDRTQHGFTLLELLISMALALTVIGATTSVYISSVSANKELLQRTRLGQELRATAGWIARDLRRAGYWGSMRGVVEESVRADLELSGLGPGTITATSSIPFAFAGLQTALVGRTFATLDAAFVARTGTITAVNVGTATLPGTLTIDMTQAAHRRKLQANTWTVLNPFATLTFTDADSNGIADDRCLMYSYDLDRDGTSDADELFGFRFNAADGTVETRDTAANCAAAGGWLSLTDPNAVEITTFIIQRLSPPVITGGGFDVAVQEFQVTFEGRLRQDPTVSQTVQETVKMRNNFVTAPPPGP